ncbi:MAG: tetratricopeptide repeat protein [Nitrospinota bacterium]
MGGFKRSNSDLVKTDRKLESFFAEGVNMKGTLKFKGNVRFDGTFKGKITSGGNLLIGEKGSVNAQILTGSLFTSGNVQGDILAVTRVQILPSGKIDGNVKAPVLQIDPGAVFNGKSEMPALLPQKTGSIEAKEEPTTDTTPVGEVICEDIGRAAGIIEPVKKKIGLRTRIAAGSAVFLFSLWWFLGTGVTEFFFEKVENSGLVFINDLFEKGRAERLLQKGEQLKQAGDLQKAAEVFRKIVNIEDVKGATRLTLARIFDELGKEKESLFEYDRLLQGDPENLEIRNEFIRILIKNGRVEKAVEELKKILAISGDNFKARLELAALYRELGKDEELYGQLAAMALQALNQIETLRELAGLQLEKGEVKNAIETYSKVAGLAPDNADVNLILARLHFRAGFEDRAVVGFAKQERLKPGHIEALNNEGFRQINKKNYSKALKQFQKVLKKERENLRASFGVVTVYTKTGQTSDAIRLCEKILKKTPEIVPVQNRLAWLYGRTKRKIERALALSRETVKANPSSADYLDTLSVLHFLKGEKKKAIEYINRAIELSPGNRYYESQLLKFKS